MTTILRSCLQLLAATLLCSIVLLANAADNALTSAIPDVTSLPAEKCTSAQNRMLESIGLGTMACTLSKHLNIESLTAALGVPMFQPNSRTDVLNASDNIENFVRYNPKFFARMNEIYTGDPDHVIYRLTYKNLFMDSARIFYLTGLDMRQKKKLNGVTMAKYKTEATSKKLTDQTWNKECKDLIVNIQGINSTQSTYQDTFKQCNKAGNAALFWYRRQIDGSGEAMFSLLDSILKNQDNDFYTKSRQVLVKK